MGRLISRVALVAAGSIVLAGGAVAAVPAGAASGGGVHARIVAASHGFPGSTPNSNIVGQGSTAKYSPAKLKVAEDTSGGDCGEATPPVSFTITNTGTKTAYITFGGTLVGGLPKGEVGNVCVYGGTAGSKLKVGLTNKAGTATYAAKLVVKTTD